MYFRAEPSPLCLRERPGCGSLALPATRLLVINWTLTIGSTYITLVVVRTDEKMNDAVLFLQVTIVLTIPTLRNLYVGLPTFGIYIGRPCSLIHSDSSYR